MFWSMITQECPEIISFNLIASLIDSIFLVNIVTSLNTIISISKSRILLQRGSRLVDSVDSGKTNKK